MKKTILLQWLVPAMLVFAFPHFFYAQNLLSNQGCETIGGSPPSSWVSTGGAWECKEGGVGGYIAAQEGAYFFWGGSVVFAELQQDVDVSFRAAFIDMGIQQYDFSCYSIGIGSDSAQVIVEYLDPTKAIVLASYDSDIFTGGGWIHLTDSRTAPVGTRFIRVRLISSRRHGGSNDGYHDNVSLAEGILLPIELTQFEAKNMGKNTLLNWQTSSEINNAGFQIQHSINGKDWKDLDFINGHGTSEKEQNYSYPHSSPQSGINYYRLRQMDFDGAHKFSKTISISFHGNENGFSLVPNPARNGGELSIRFDHENEGILNVFSFTGQQVYHRVVNEGQLDLNVQLSHLPEGIYMVEWLTGQGRFVEKLILE